MAGGRFEPGVSGNPGGRPSVREVAAIARRYTPDALRALVEVCRTAIDNPFVQTAAECLEEVFGERPFYLYEGGSVPAGATFSDKLGLPVLLLGFTQPDDQAHAPNESMRLDNYEGGLRTLVRYWERLGRSS